MNNKLSETRKTLGVMVDQPPNGSEDLGSAKNLEQLETRLTSRDFRKMQDLFKVSVLSEAEG